MILSCIVCASAGTWWWAADVFIDGPSPWYDLQRVIWSNTSFTNNGRLQWFRASRTTVHWAGVTVRRASESHVCMIAVPRFWPRGVTYARILISGETFTPIHTSTVLKCSISVVFHAKLGCSPPNTYNFRCNNYNSSEGFCCCGRDVNTRRDGIISFSLLFIWNTINQVNNFNFASGTHQCGLLCVNL